MEDFKQNPKMQCFKEGGQVKYESRKEHAEEMKSDVNQDKKIVKKAFSMHDKQEHPGKKTDLSKLNKGGRAKKAVGTVKKFACGGGVYGAKKTKEDIKSIESAKNCKPKKLADGGMSGLGAISDMERAAMQSALPGGQSTGSPNDMERRRMMARGKNAMKYLGPAQQSEFVNQGGMAPPPPPPPPAGPAGMPMQKRGGKVKKCAEGGSLKEVDAQENPGLSKLPTDVRNKMGYMRKGGKAKKSC